MNKSVQKLVAGFAAVGFFVSGALANDAVFVAELVGPSGKVMVNAGEGYTVANDSLKLVAGSKIFVGTEAAVTVSYNSCAVVLSQPTVYTVPAKSPCAPGQKVANVPGMSELVIRPTDGHVLSNIDYGNTALLVGGIAVVGLGGFLLYDVLDDDKKTPATPATP